MKQSKKTKKTSKKNNKPKYKVVFLDWNGTLSASKFWGHMEKTNNELFTKIENSLFGNLRDMIKPWMRGQIRSEEVIIRISEDSKIPYTDLFKEFIIGCQKMEFVSGDTLEKIKKLRSKKIKAVIATDNMDSFVRWTVPALKLHNYFDDILDSYTLKAMKGDMDEKGNSLFFSTYISIHNLKPGKSTLIDDSEDKEGRIGKVGIEYRKIEPVKGLIPELENLLALLG